MLCVYSVVMGHPMPGAYEIQLALNEALTQNQKAASSFAQMTSSAGSGKRTGTSSWTVQTPESSNIRKTLQIRQQTEVRTVTAYLGIWGGYFDGFCLASY